MIFARKVWLLLVGIKDALALLFLLAFFFMLYAALSVRPGAGNVRDGALLLRLDGSIVEEPEAGDPLQLLLGDQAPVAQYAARDIVRALRAAAGDTRIKAVVFDLSRFTGAGMVNLLEIGKAMDTVRAAGKPVLVYGTVYADDGVLLAAHASESWVHPLGGAFIAGPGGEQLYYKGLFDKLKVNAHIFRVGTYKSAVEPFLLDSMSDASREQTQALYAALFESWNADIAKARPKAQVARVTADPAGWLAASGGDMARAAVDAGLIDRIGSETAFGERVAALAGKDRLDGAPGSFAHTALATYLPAVPPSNKGRAIGVVTIAGEIVDGDAGPGTAGGDRIAGLLDDALDSDLAALVVRIDSPGGSLLASERIREALGRYKAKNIPIVVSMANVAASGGYWVATPAKRIFAEPGTITGSIGVFAIVPTFEATLAGFGVTTDGVRTTPLSGQPDLVGGLTPEVSAMLQANVEASYRRFLALVGKARGKTPADIDRIAQGRVWDGGTARQIGLVDQFGGLDEALAYAAEQAGLGGKGKDGNDWHPVFLGGGNDVLSQMLARFGGGGRDGAAGSGRDWASAVSARQSSVMARALADAARLLDGRGVQAYCLECAANAPASLPNRGTGGLIGLAARLIPQAGR